MNNILNQTLYYFSQFLRGEFVYRANLDLQKTKHLSLDELTILQGKRLAELLQYSIKYSAFYRDYYKEFIGEIQNASASTVFEVFAKLPILSKQQAIEEYSRILSTKRHSTHMNISSGTTGEPFEFPCDRSSWAYRHAAIIRFLDIHGVKFGEKYGYFSGQHWRKELALKTKLKDRFFNRYKLSAFDINDQSVRECYNWLFNHKASYIHGYPSTIFDFIIVSKELLDLDLRKLDLKLIMATGETLSKHQRDAVTNNMNCPIRNYYGSVEGGAGAFEGLEGYMHENMETTYLHIEKDEIYKTDLFLRKFPLIKFKTGDFVEPIKNEPNTDLKHRIIGHVIGRTGEKIKLPNGKTIHSMILNYFIDLFTTSRTIRKFRFVFSPEDILLIIEPMDFEVGIEQELETGILKEMGVVFPNCNLKVKKIQSLPTLINGKHRDWVYSRD